MEISYDFGDFRDVPRSASQKDVIGRTCELKIRHEEAMAAGTVADNSLLGCAPDISILSI